MNVFGVDCGSHRVKLFTPYQQVMFDRYLMKAKPRPLDSIGSYDKWHVTVNDKEYFIGQLAEMEGAALKTTVKENNFITGNTKESLCGGSYICTLLV